MAASHIPPSPFNRTLPLDLKIMRSKVWNLEDFGEASDVKEGVRTDEELRKKMKMEKTSWSWLKKCMRNYMKSNPRLEDGEFLKSDGQPETSSHAKREVFWKAFSSLVAFVMQAQNRPETSLAYHKEICYQLFLLIMSMRRKRFKEDQQLRTQRIDSASVQQAEPFQMSATGTISSYPTPAASISHDHWASSSAQARYPHQQRIEMPLVYPGPSFVSRQAFDVRATGAQFNPLLPHEPTMDMGEYRHGGGSHLHVGRSGESFDRPAGLAEESGPVPISSLLTSSDAVYSPATQDQSDTSTPSSSGSPPDSPVEEAEYKYNGPDPSMTRFKFTYKTGPESSSCTRLVKHLCSTADADESDTREYQFAQIQMGKIQELATDHFKIKIHRLDLKNPRAGRDAAIIATFTPNNAIGYDFEAALLNCQGHHFEVELFGAVLSKPSIRKRKAIDSSPPPTSTVPSEAARKSSRPRKLRRTTGARIVKSSQGSAMATTAAPAVPSTRQSDAQSPYTPLQSYHPPPLPPRVRSLQTASSDVPAYAVNQSDAKSLSSQRSEPGSAKQAIKDLPAPNSSHNSTSRNEDGTGDLHVRFRRELSVQPVQMELDAAGPDLMSPSHHIAPSDHARTSADQRSMHRSTQAIAFNTIANMAPDADVEAMLELKLSNLNQTERWTTQLSSPLLAATTIPRSAASQSITRDFSQTTDNPDYTGIAGVDHIWKDDPLQAMCMQNLSEVASPSSEHAGQTDDESQQHGESTMGIPPPPPPPSRSPSPTLPAAATMADQDHGQGMESVSVVRPPSDAQNIRELLETKQKALQQKYHQLMHDRADGWTAEQSDSAEEEIRCQVAAYEEALQHNLDNGDPFDLEAFSVDQPHYSCFAAPNAEQMHECLLDSVAASREYEHWTDARQSECWRFFNRQDVDDLSDFNFDFMQHNIHHYQVYGAYLLLERSCGLNGARLADAQGLGHTHTLIFYVALVAWLHHAFADIRTTRRDGKPDQHLRIGSTCSTGRCPTAVAKKYPMLCPCEPAFPGWLLSVLQSGRLPLGSPIILLPPQCLTEQTWIKVARESFNTRFVADGGLFQLRFFVAHNSFNESTDYPSVQKLQNSHCALFASDPISDEGTVEQSARVIISSAQSYDSQVARVLLSGPQEPRMSYGPVDAPEINMQRLPAHLVYRGTTTRTALTRQFQPCVFPDVMDEQDIVQHVRHIGVVAPKKPVLRPRSFYNHNLMILDESRRRMNVNEEQTATLFNANSSSPFRKAFVVSASVAPWTTSIRELHTFVSAAQTRNNRCVPKDDTWPAIPPEMKRFRMQVTEYNLLSTAFRIDQRIGRSDSSSVASVFALVVKQMEDWVRQILQPFMIRRTSCTTHNGRPIVDLAAIIWDRIYVEPAPGQQQIAAQAFAASLEHSSMGEGRVTLQSMERNMDIHQSAASFPRMIEIVKSHELRGLTTEAFNDRFKRFRAGAQGSQVLELLQSEAATLLKTSSKMYWVVKHIKQSISVLEEPDVRLLTQSPENSRGTPLARARKYIVVTSDPISAVSTVAVLRHHFNKQVALLNPVTGKRLRVKQLADNLSIEERQKIIQGFQQVTKIDSDGSSQLKHSFHDYDILVVTLSSLPPGMSLQRATTIYMLEPWWTTSSEKQAMRLVHGIEQCFEVKCYTLVANGMICDEGIVERAKIREEVAEQNKTIGLESTNHPNDSTRSFPSMYRKADGSWSQLQYARRTPAQFLNMVSLPADVIANDPTLELSGLWACDASVIDWVKSRAWRIPGKSDSVRVFDVRHYASTAEEFEQTRDRMRKHHGSGAESG